MLAEVARARAGGEGSPSKAPINSVAILQVDYPCTHTVTGCWTGPHQSRDWPKSALGLAASMHRRQILRVSVPIVRRRRSRCAPVDYPPSTAAAVCRRTRQIRGSRPAMPTRPRQASSTSRSAPRRLPATCRPVRPNAPALPCVEYSHYVHRGVGTHSKTLRLKHPIFPFAGLCHL